MHILKPMEAIGRRVELASGKFRNDYNLCAFSNILFRSDAPLVIVPRLSEARLSILEYPIQHLRIVGIDEQRIPLLGSNLFGMIDCKSGIADLRPRLFTGCRVVFGPNAGGPGRFFDVGTKMETRFS